MSESISLKVRYEKNSNLIISPNEVISKYLFDTPIASRSGKQIPFEDFKFFIQSATEQMENYLNLLFHRQVYKETVQFVAEDYRQWGYIRTTYPLVCPLELVGALNTTRQVKYPKEWLVARKTSDNILYHRNLTIVPAGNATANSMSYLFSGILANFGSMGNGRIPDYWSIKYVTGFDKVPSNIVDAIGKLAAVNVLRISGDLLLPPGVSSFSLGIDGLSQSISGRTSATNSAFDARINGYLKELNDKILPELKGYYKGFIFGVC